jgi:hypothetical protein
MVTLAAVTRNARYWHGLAAGLCSGNKGKCKINVTGKDWSNEPLLRLDGRSCTPSGVDGSRSE